MISKTLALNLPILGTFKLRPSFKIFSILLITAIFSLLFVCVYQLNRHTQEVYLIKDLEKRINQLSEENKVLEISFSNANSLKNINNYLQNESFVKVGRVDYIYLLGGTALAK